MRLVKGGGSEEMTAEEMKAYKVAENERPRRVLPFMSMVQMRESMKAGEALVSKGSKVVLRRERGRTGGHTFKGGAKGKESGTIASAGGRRLTQQQVQGGRRVIHKLMQGGKETPVSRANMSLHVPEET